MSDPQTILQGLLCCRNELHERAQQLSRQLGLPLIDSPCPPCLRLDEAGLALLPDDSMGPVRVDFAGGAMGHRRRFGGGRGQALARAVGLKGGANPRIIDASAGLGKDGFVLASLGCSVRLIERSTVIAALLQDGLQRALAEPELADWLPTRLQLYPGDALARLPQLCAEQPADVIYLDPMFPERKKSALVKKEMRLFRQLVGEDDDAGAVLETALGLALHRVVVKRPRKGSALPGVKPSYQIEGKTTRYDIYLPLARR